MAKELEILLSVPRSEVATLISLLAKRKAEQSRGRYSVGNLLV